MAAAAAKTATTGARRLCERGIWYGSFLLGAALRGPSDTTLVAGACSLLNACSTPAHLDLTWYGRCGGATHPGAARGAGRRALATARRASPASAPRGAPAARARDGL